MIHADFGNNSIVAYEMVSAFETEKTSMRVNSMEYEPIPEVAMGKAFDSNTLLTASSDMETESLNSNLLTNQSRRAKIHLTVSDGDIGMLNKSARKWRTK